MIFISVVIRIDDGGAVQSVVLVSQCVMQAS